MTTQKGTTNVRVELQYVRNLGNYESLRVSIGVEDFVRDGETVDSATERVYEFVENKVVEKVGEMEKELKHG
jgi:argininosuccinate lyase